MVVLCIVSYISTIFLISHYTYWGGQIGELGGVLDYRAFGISDVYHLTKDNLKGQLLLSFPDITAYLLTTIILINFAAIYAENLERNEQRGYRVRNYALLNLTVTTLCMLSYVLHTMMPINDELHHSPVMGGVVDYLFPFYIWVTHVSQGHIETSLNWPSFDFTLWLLFTLFISTVIMTVKQLGSQNEA